ncbi:MAG: hypothetical protein AAGD92_05905 [Pseudomonadota bacterium]
MKVIQYRFNPQAQSHSKGVGEAVADFFKGQGETNLLAISVDEETKEHIVRKKISVQDIASKISSTFLESYSNQIDYTNFYSIKSIISCRFVVVDGEGLIRICYSSNDQPIEFKGLRSTAEDISNYLIETDIFDFF